MSQPAYLWLTLGGEDIEGESTVTSIGRENRIVCHAFEHEMATPRDERTGRIAGRRRHQPVRIVKRVDKSTPRLMRALCERETVDRAEFRFYRPAPDSGGEEHFYTVLLEDGLILGIRQEAEDELIVGDEAPPMLEEVTFAFAQITWTHEISGNQHQDTTRF